MSQGDNDSFDHATAEALLSALRQVSVSVPSWHLKETDRWHLFRDLLFGNCRVRGSLRPRDLPLDAACMQVLTAASKVQAMRPYQDANGRIAFRHWLACFCLLNSVATAREPTPKLSHSQQLACVITELVMSLHGAVPLTKPLLAAIAKHPFTQRLIGVLGLSQQEWESLRQTTGRDPAKRCVSLARHAALIMAIPNPPQLAHMDRQQWREELAAALRQKDFPELHAEKKKAVLKSLDEQFCRQATLKIPGVQRYIAQGKHHWNFRGASAWCSQTLGVARDYFLDSSNGLMSSDSDAIVAAWLPSTADEPSLNDALRASMKQMWCMTPPATEAMHAPFPRLAEWLTQKIAALRTADSQISPLADNQLPTFNVRCKEPWSLLQVCTHRAAPEPKKRDAPNIPRPAEDASTECAHVIGHPPVFSEYPPWLSPDSSRGRVGVAAVAWSLCGTTYRTHAHEGLCEAIGERQLQLQSVHHGKWLETLGMPDSHLTHLKLDGDHVGGRFTQEPLADSTWLSIELARLMQCRLIAGVRDTLAEHKRQHPLLAHRPLPVDVVYLGGDDLYVCLPWDLVDVFLSGFGGEAVQHNPWNDLQFTFIAARLQPKDIILKNVDPNDWEAVAAKLDAANQTAARLLTYGLCTVKDSLRTETPLDVNALQTLADLQCMRVQADPDVHHRPRVCGRVIDVNEM